METDTDCRGAIGQESKRSIRGPDSGNCQIFGRPIGNGCLEYGTNNGNPRSCDNPRWRPHSIWLESGTRYCDILSGDNCSGQTARSSGSCASLPSKGNINSFICVRFYPVHLGNINLKKFM